jgi:dihydropteroate synthase
MASTERSPTPRWGFATFEAGDPRALYLRPVGRLTGAAATDAIKARHALSTGRPAEAAPFVEILARNENGGAERILAPIADFLSWLDAAPAHAARQRLQGLADRLAGPRPAWAGFSLDRPLVMGIVNVTPDSFSDGGEFLDPSAAVAHGRALRAAGADILDIGGESTRPGAAPVAPMAEVARVVPVIRALAQDGAVISVDTRRPAVMAAALEAGARIINDVTGLAEPGALEIVARHRTPVVLMHMQGEPQTMQANPLYDMAALDVFDYLEARLAVCEAAGLPRSGILIDPGIGFGKTLTHNVELMSMLGIFRVTGCGVLLGVSRKSFFRQLARIDQPKDRLPGSLAAGLAGVMRGADVVRVHDVAETVQALRVLAAIEQES